MLACCASVSLIDAIELLRGDAFFRDALGLSAVPPSPTLRQRMDALGEAGDSALRALEEVNERLMRARNQS
jgi:hypothetical protein